MAILDLKGDVVKHVIGTDVQAWDAGLDDIAALAVTDGNFIVGDGSNWVAESGATARTSLSLGTMALEAATDYVEIAGDTMTGALIDTIEDAATNTVTNIVTLGHNSTETPLADYGTGLLFQLASDTTPDQDAAQIAAVWSDPTHASRDADIVWNTVYNGEALDEVMRLTADGKLQLTGSNVPIGATQLDVISASSTGIRVDSGGNAVIKLDKGGNNRSAVFAMITAGVQKWAFGTTDSDSGYTGDEFYFGLNAATPLFFMERDGRTGLGGVTSPAALLDIDQSSTVGAVPVLKLDQADVSEEMIELATTIGVGNAIEAVGVKTLTTTHFIKVTITGVGAGYIPWGSIA